MTGPARHKMPPPRIDGDEYYTTSKGLVVNISELVRIYQAVTAQIEPGMSEEEIDRIIHETNQRMTEV